MLNTIPVEVSEKVNELIQAAIRVSLAQEQVDKMREQYDFKGERKKLDMEEECLVRESEDLVRERAREDMRCGQYRVAFENWLTKQITRNEELMRGIYYHENKYYDEAYFIGETYDPFILLLRKQNGFDRFKQQWLEGVERENRLNAKMQNYNCREQQFKQKVSAYNERIAAGKDKKEKLEKVKTEYSRLTNELTTVVGSIKGQLELV